MDIPIQRTPVLFNCSCISLLACRRKTTQHRTPCDSNITSIKLHITVSYWSITLRVDILIQLTPVLFNCSRISLLACRRKTTQHRTPCDSNITSIKLHITVSYWSITLRVDILIQLTPVRFNCSRIALLACRRRTTQHRTP